MTTTQPRALQDFGFYSDIDVQAATVAAIREVLAVLPVRDRWCVEFGAWDGLVGSTTRDLIVNQGYSAVLIEGDPVKFRELQRNYASNTGVTARNQFVGFDENDGLDSILSATPIPADFDFLTIDIDGNDYHVWRAVRRYRPKVVMIEFNPTIPPEVRFIQPADPSINQGSSLSAIAELMQSKEYELVAVIGVNALFVRRELFPLFHVADNGINTLWTKRDCITYLFTGFDGRVFLCGCKKLPWQDGIPFPEEKMQVLPSFLRGSRFTRRKRILYELLNHPMKLLKKIGNRFTGSSVS